MADTIETTVVTPETPTPRVFEAAYTPSEDAYIALSEVSQRHGGVLTLICGIIILAGGTIIVSLGSLSGIAYLLFGALFLVLFMRQAHLVGRTSWKARNTALDGAPMQYRFDEQYFYLSHPLDAETLDYRLITKIAETETYFFLYVNGIAAHPIPKSTLTGGTVDDFRRFLITHCLKPVTFVSVRRKRRRRTLLGVLAIVLAVVIAVATYAGGFLKHEMPLCSDDTVATITLPRYLGVQIAENEYFATYGRDVTVVASYYTFDELEEYFELADPTWESYREYLVSEDLITKEATWTTLPNGIYYAACDFEDFYATGCTGYAVYWTEDGCFEWAFGGEGTLEEYGPLFAAWAESITFQAAQ